MRQVLTGWPEHRRQLPDAVKPYHAFHDDLFTQDGLLYKGRCVVIPSSLQRDLVSRLHRTHIGLASILRLARQNVFWIGMTSMLKDAILRCPTCIAHRPAPAAEPLLSHDVPSRPWAKLGADLFELNGSMYLVLVDYYSNFVEVDRLSRTTVTHVTSALSAHFARYGIPEILVSDNGPPFSSSDFRAFLRMLDVHHITSSPGYPQSNGKAENAVKTVKILMRKALASGEDPVWALMMWRNSPDESSSLSPAQKMFGRACRTFLPTPRSNLLPTYPTSVARDLAKQKSRQAKYYNRRTQPLAPLVPGQSIHMRLPGRRTWSPGVCVGTAGLCSYWVRVNDVTYRRNRRQLLTTRDPPPVIGDGAGAGPDDRVSESEAGPADRMSVSLAPPAPLCDPFDGSDARPVTRPQTSCAPPLGMTPPSPVALRSPPSPAVASRSPATASDLHIDCPSRRPQRTPRPPAYLSDYVR